MKKKQGLCGGITVLLLVVMFVFAGCPLPPAPGTVDGGEPGDVFSISGKFNDGQKDVLFTLRDEGDNSRAVTAESYAVSGELQDGDITFRLKGTYDPDTLKYTASAASSLIRYSIDGAFDEDGDSLGSTATLLVKGSNDEWVAHSYVVTEAASVNITAPEATEDDVAEGGIPDFALGYWDLLQDFGEGNGKFEAKLLLSQWTMSMDSVQTDSEGQKSYDSDTASVVEFIGTSSPYDLIMGFPVYKGSQEQVESAAKAFLTSKGLSESRLLDLPDGYYIYYVFDGTTVLNYGGFFTNDYSQEETIRDEILAAIASESQLSYGIIDDIIGQILVDNGIDLYSVEILHEDPYAGITNGLYCYYNAMYGDLIWTYFSSGTPYNDSVWAVADAWWNTNYLKQYLIKEGVSPTTMYQKLKVTVAAGNDNMTVVPYYNGHDDDDYVSEWVTVAEAKAATVIDEDSIMQLSR